MDFDQAGVAYEAFHCGPNLTIEHPLEEQPNPASLPSAVTLTHQISLSVGSSSSSSSEVMSQLTSMISGLERANQSMITLRGSHTSKERFQDWAEDVRKSFDLSNTLESILIHTESLATLYSTVSKLISSANQPRHRQDCHLPDCIHEYAQDRPDTPSLTQHYSLLNMLLSCHFKVLDIVDSIIGLCNTCSRTIVALPMVQDAHFDFPQIRIGSFVASPSATVPLFTTMLCQLLLDLQEKNRDMSRSLSLSPQGDGVADSRELQLLNLQSDIIKDRTAGTLESMRRTQAYFLDKGIVK